MKHGRQFLAFTVAALAGAALANPPFPGSYDVTGKNPDGSSYKGTLQIEVGSKDTYRLTWRTPGAVPGIGISDGRLLVAGYGSPNCGVAAYSVKDDGSLVGDWAQGSLAGSERAKPTGDASADMLGDYVVEGTNPDGSSYKGALLVSQDRGGPVLTWRTGNDAQGVGMKVGRLLVAGYGGRECGVVAYAFDEDGVLKGLWRSPGMANGEEYARRR